MEKFYSNNAATTVLNYIWDKEITINSIRVLDSQSILSYKKAVTQWPT